MTAVPAVPPPDPRAQPLAPLLDVVGRALRYVTWGDASDAETERLIDDLVAVGTGKPARHVTYERGLREEIATLKVKAEEAESDLNDTLADLATTQNDGLFWRDANQQLVDENNKLLAQVARYRLALADTPENVTDAMKAYWDVKGDRRGSMTATLAHLRAQAERPTANPEQAVIPNVGGTYEDAIAAWAASHS